jgi:phosphoglycerate dehydrogenase-like enzyme
MQILAMLWNKKGKKMAKIKLAVIGYGNIGRGVLEAIKKTQIWSLPVFSLDLLSALEPK